MSTHSVDLKKIFDDARSKREKFEAKIREENDARRKESEAAKRKRNSFLSAIQAVQLPVELYAIWLDAHLRNGGRLSGSSSHNFVDDQSMVATGTIGSSEDPLKFSPSSVPEWLLATAWPTAPGTPRGQEPKGIPIPEGYGAHSIKLMVLPDLLPNANFERAYRRDRKGWEWGHTRVFRLSKSSTPGQFEAWTNEPDHVYTYPDVEALLLQYDTSELVARARRALSRPIFPATKQID